MYLGHRVCHELDTYCFWESTVCSSTSGISAGLDTLDSLAVPKSSFLQIWMFHKRELKVVAQSALKNKEHKLPKQPVIPYSCIFPFLPLQSFLFTGITVVGLVSELLLRARSALADAISCRLSLLSWISFSCSCLSLELMLIFCKGRGKNH